MFLGTFGLYPWSSSLAVARYKADCIRSRLLPMRFSENPPQKTVVDRYCFWVRIAIEGLPIKDSPSKAGD